MSVCMCKSKVTNEVECQASGQGYVEGPSAPLISLQALRSGSRSKMAANVREHRLEVMEVLSSLP